MMQRPGAPMEVARRIIASVAGEAQRPEELADSAQAAYRQLRERLVVLLGPGGFDALWARALRQVQREAGLQARPAGETPSAASDGALHALVHAEDVAASRERLIAVFGACIGLLYTFIGQDLSFRLVQQVWPDLPLGEPRVTGEEATA